ncbi:MAG TPA: cyclic nucleotide-binding domain-containing protein [Acidimicrobiales bacterium]
MRRYQTDLKLQRLSRVAPFDSLGPADLRDVASAADDLELHAGEILCEQGRRGIEAFVVVEGELDVSVDGEHLSVIGPGEWAGEMSLLDGGGRSATVTAATDAWVAVFVKPALTRLLSDHPHLSRHLMRTLTVRLRSATVS